MPPPHLSIENWPYEGLFDSAHLKMLCDLTSFYQLCGFLEAVSERSPLAHTLYCYLHTEVVYRWVFQVGYIHLA